MDIATAATSDFASYWRWLDEFSVSFTLKDGEPADWPKDIRENHEIRILGFPLMRDDGCMKSPVKWSRHWPVRPTSQATLSKLSRSLHTASSMSSSKWPSNYD